MLGLVLAVIYVGFKTLVGASVPLTVITGLNFLQGWYIVWTSIALLFTAILFLGGSCGLIAAKAEGKVYGLACMGIGLLGAFVIAIKSALLLIGVHLILAASAVCPEDFSKWDTKTLIVGGIVYLIGILAFGKMKFDFNTKKE